MILFLIFLALVSGALIVKIPLLGLFFMVIITYIVFIQRISYIVYALILISVIISSTYFYSNRDTFKEETIGYFTISDYKYNNDKISYIGKYKNYRFYVYMENEALLPIGTVCSGDFEVVKPNIERNFIKRNQSLSMKISNIVGSIYVKEDRLNCSETKKTVKMKINTLKYKYTKKVLKTSNYPYTGDILMLSIGNKMMLDSQFFSALQKLGIYHLYVISGTHVAYITMVLIFLFTRFRLPIEYVKALVVICLLIFLIVNIFSPSVLRAVLMAVLLIITSYFNKKPYLAIISLTAIIQFVIHPYIIFHAGFQLSYITTFTIILSRHLFNDRPPFIQMIIVTVICEVCTIVLILFHFNEVSFSGILMNLIFGPIFSFVIFPSVFIFNVSLFTYFSEWFDHLLHLVFSTNTSLILYLGNVIEHRLPIKNISSIFIVILTIISYFHIRTVLTKSLKEIIRMTLIFIVFLLLSSFNFKDDIKFVMVDVGQGDAFLIIDEKYNETILVDTGGKFYRNDYEIHLAEKTILPYLKENGIRKIDLLVISHMDNDHMGEATYISSKLPIKNLYINPRDEKLTDDYLKQFSESNIIYSTDFSELKLKRVTLKNVNNITHTKNSNDQSIVLDVNLFDYHILMLGDLSIEYEEEILKNVKKIDIVKIGHHGSNTSTGVDLVEREFNLALISSGVNNSYGHPHKEVTDILTEYNKEIVSTKESGMVEITFKKNGYCTKHKLRNIENRCYK